MITYNVCSLVYSPKPVRTHNHGHLLSDSSSSTVRPIIIYCPTHHHLLSDSSPVRNLGVILDRRLSMKEHINKVCQMAYWELRRISSIRQYLTEDAAKTLVVSLVLSRLDYGNCLLAGVPNVFYINSKKSRTHLPD